MLLIKNGKIIDGTGKPAYQADILISDDKISAIGTFPKKAGFEVIDALGFSVTPGFIDPNTDSDHYLSLFTNPRQDDFLLQGVTTIIGGHCGASLAPLLYSSLESVRKWGDPSQINVNWRSVGEFLNVLEKIKLGVNFGTLMGHGTIRRALIGEALRDLTDRELEVFKKIISDGLQEGALGLSIGLGYAHSRLVPYLEIKKLVAVLGEQSICTVHPRNERDGLVAAVQEAVKLSEETGVKTIISHLRPLNGYAKAIREVRALFDNLPEKTDVHFDTYPFDASLVPIYTLLPDWFKRGNLENMWTEIVRPGKQDELRRAFKSLPLEQATIALAPNNKYLVGKTVAEFGINQEVSREEALLRLMILTRMKAVLMIRDIDGAVAEEMIFDKRAMVGSNGAALSKNEYAVNPERALRTFPKYLRLAANREDTTLEEAVKKITYLPAKKFGLRGRGVIKEKAYADLVLLKGAAVETVVLNGRVAVREGTVQNIRAGSILRKS